MTQNGKLFSGDIVGVITPSRHIIGNEKNIKKSITLLENYGFKVKLGKCFKKRTYSNAGNRFQRADEINAMFADRQVKAVFCSLGGDAANQVLDLLDYKLIEKNPKPIIGYSDITHLLLAIYSKTGMPTFYGPNLSSLSALSKSSVQQLVALLTNQKKQNIFSECRIIKSGEVKGTARYPFFKTHIA